MAGLHRLGRNNTVFDLLIGVYISIVPKRAFADAEQLNHFRALLGNTGRQTLSVPPIPEPQ